MALVLADRVRDTTTTTGTGTITLSGTAPTGYQNFSVVGNGNTTYYTINAASQWEVGIGTYSSTGPTLSRDTVLASSNAGSLVNFSSGTKDVFITYPAEKSVNYDASGNVGVGTPSPGAKLDVAGNSYFRSDMFVYQNGGIFFNGNGSYGGAGVYARNTGADLVLAANGGEGARLTATGFGVGVSSPSVKFSASGSAGDPTLNAASGVAEFRVNTTQMLAIGGYASGSYGMWLQGKQDNGGYTTSTWPIILQPSGGNVGVGTPSPGVKLDVTGSIRASQSVTIGGGGTYAAGSIYSDGNWGMIFRAYQASPNQAQFLWTSSPDNELLRIDTAGSLISTFSVRAPIFYDNNNTAYYLDPASTSLLGGALFNNVTIDPSSIGAGVGVGTITESSTGFSAPGIAFGGGTGQHGAIVYAGDTMYFGAENGSDNTLGVRATLNNSGSFAATGDVRAPIFYDSNDTSYYVNPASGSVLGGTVSILGSRNITLSSSSGSVQIRGDSGGWSNGLLFYGSAGTYRGGFGALGGGNTLDYYWVGSDYNTAALYVYPSGVVQASNSLRAPIFVDSDNTGYYLDPAGTSVLGQINFGDSTKFIRGGASGQIILGAGSASDAYIQVGGSYYPIWNSGNFTPGNYMPISGGTFTGAVGFPGGSAVTVNGDFVSRRSNGSTGVYYFVDANDKYLYWDGGQYLFGGSYTVAATRFYGVSDVRAPIFYDSDNTAYYVNPAGASALNSVTFGLYPTSAGGGGQIVPATGSPYSLRQDFGSDNTGWRYGVAKNVSGTATVLFYVQDNGAVVSLGDMRAPIFYDSDNTGYYVDPASTSNLNRLLLQPRIDNYYVGSVSSTDPVSNWQSLTDTTGQFVVSQFNNFGAGGFTNYPSGVYTYGAVLSWRTTNHSFQLFASHTGDLAYKTQWNNDNYSGWLTPVVYGRNAGSSSGKTIYGTILYDADNTSYYCDPNTTSILWETRSYYLTNIAAVNEDHRFGVYFSNDRNEHYAITREAGAWASPYPDLRIGFYTGMKFMAESSYGGMRFYNETSYTTQIMSISNSADPLGAGNVYVNNSLQAGSSLRAPIFYDSDNTYYYVNPATNSTLANIDVASIIDSAAYYDAAIEVRERSFGGSQTTSFNNAPRLGFHWGGRVAMQLALGADGIFNVMNGDCSAYATFRAGNVYGNTFIDNNNSAYYVDPSGDAVLAGNLFIGQAANSSYIYMGDGDNGQRVIHNNSDRIGFLTQAGGWGSWCEDDGSWRNDSYMQTPIIYDINNTAYYLDPASTSVLRGLTLNDSVPTITFSSTTSGRSSAFGMTDAYNMYLNAPSGGILFLSTFQAPNMYDRDNTAYYVDPASNSVFNTLQASNVVCYPGWPGSPGIDANAYTFSAISSFTYSNNAPYTGPFVALPAGGYGLQFNAPYSGGGNGLSFRTRNGDASTFNSWYALAVYGSSRSAGDLYATVYYDANDTGYYVNPNGGSSLSTVTVNDTIYSYNWFRSYGNTGWYNQTYGGGLYMFDTTWVRVYNAKSFYTDADIAAAGNVTAYYSDERLKTKTGVIDNALDKVSSLEGFLYVENDLARSLGYTNDKQQVGVSAQQVQAVLPEAVSLAPVDFETLEDGTIVSKSGEDYLTVDYSRLVPLLIEAIKELKSEVNDLKAALQ
jgi:hypothetical protein